MTLTDGEERGNLRSTLARLFEEGAVAVRGDGAFLDATTTLIPATIRIVGMGTFPWFIVEFTAVGSGQTLSSTRIFSLDGAIDAIEAHGPAPATWTAEV
jgi:hypothetical protein